ncbi:hypothetical protein T472_0212485 [Youngiibacter fragilis 232.1]|uniref:Uncharacterized protein n=1 Tax=Youngiibacter fragilis 232.1 TaxID=994573 RepID=V7I501_9CLOT|nr:hypothetical protein T472_0212485 [Youngiibacter fragilis 232.1]
MKRKYNGGRNEDQKNKLNVCYGFLIQVRIEDPMIVDNYVRILELVTMCPSIKYIYFERKSF